MQAQHQDGCVLGNRVWRQQLQLIDIPSHPSQVPPTSVERQSPRGITGLFRGQSCLLRDPGSADLPQLGR